MPTTFHIMKQPEKFVHQKVHIFQCPLQKWLEGERNKNTYQRIESKAKKNNGLGSHSQGREHRLNNHFLPLEQSSFSLLALLIIFFFCFLYILTIYNFIYQLFYINAIYFYCCLSTIVSNFPPLLCPSPPSIPPPFGFVHGPFIDVP